MPAELSSVISREWTNSCQTPCGFAATGCFGSGSAPGARSPTLRSPSITGDSTPQMPVPGWAGTSNGVRGSRFSMKQPICLAWMPGHVRRLSMLSGSGALRGRTPTRLKSERSQNLCSRWQWFYWPQHHPGQRYRSGFANRANCNPAFNLQRLADSFHKLDAIRKYVSTDQVPIAALMKMAKLGTVIDTWMEQTEVSISAIQCWTSLEEFFGVVPCTVMSMMSENLMSSACEVDICGVIGMHALQLASETPSALLDWNNNYGDDPDKAVCFHCSNLPKHFFKSVKMDFQQIIAGTVGRENTYGTCEGLVKVHL